MTKSHMLCNEVESALKASQDGLALTSNLEAGAIKHGYETEFALLSAKCLVQLPTGDGELETVVSLCKKVLSLLASLSPAARGRIFGRFSRSTLNFRSFWLLPFCARINYTIHESCWKN